MFGQGPTPTVKKTATKLVTHTSELSQFPTEGYSCTLYHDYLVFYGGKYGEEVIDQASVYNLKEKRLERNQARSGRNLSLPKFSHSAYLCEKEGVIIFYGGDSEVRTSWNKPTEYSQNPVLRINQAEDELEWSTQHGLHGKYLPSPIINLSQEILYLYQPGRENGNFGSFYRYTIHCTEWQEYPGINGNLRFSGINDKAIFCDNNLYLFAENEDNGIRKRGEDDRIFEDVYVLDIAEHKNSPPWRRVSPGGQVPGLLRNISMAVANGIIYVFGTSLENYGGDKNYVLWTYDTKNEKWNEVKEIGTLTARPNQRAVIYKDQLLIVDWDYPSQSVTLQSQNLHNLSFAVSAPGNKQICRDQPDSFVQQYKNLYNGRFFADITFEVEGEEIPTHKALLAYRSDYFMKMFTSGMSESHSTRISIPNMKSHILKALLQYIYCNEIELDEQLALDLIPVVDEYLMKGLKGLCEKYLCKQLRKENVVDMLIVADRHEIEELKRSCFRFILKNLGNIDENEEMMKLSKSLFIELLKFNTTPSNSQSQPKPEDEKSNSFNPYQLPMKVPTTYGGYPQPQYLTKTAVLQSTGTKAPRKVSASSDSSA